MFKDIISCEDHNTMYIETQDGKRAIIRDGQYDGWYDPELNVVLG